MTACITRLLFQPTRPRGARRGTSYQPGSLKSVSTHAPARGATNVWVKIGIVFGVSTHAPARGATICYIYLVKGKASFNPRAREGRDSSSMHSHRIEPITLYRKSLSADFSTLITPIRRANPARTSLGNLQSLRFARDFRTETVYTSRRNYLCARR